MVIIVQVFIVLFAMALAWEAIKGFRGVPNAKGKHSGMVMSSVLAVVAITLVVLAFLVLPTVIEGL